jgi:thiol-disulfide isomerase/thioredoxin
MWKCKFSKGLLLAAAMLLQVAVAFAAGRRAAGQPVKVVVYYDAAGADDILQLIVATNYYINQDNPNNVHLSSRIGENGSFSFTIPPEVFSGYFMLGLKRRQPQQGDPSTVTLLSPILFSEPGDSVVIRIGKKPDAPAYDYTFRAWYHYAFSGRGSKKYGVQLAMDSIFKTSPKHLASMFGKDFSYHEPFTDAYAAAIGFLDANRDSLSGKAYQVLKANILYADVENRFSWVENYYRDSILTKGARQRRQFEAMYSRSPLARTQIAGTPPAFLESSMGFIAYSLERAVAECLILRHTEDPAVIYDLIKHTYSGKVRDELILSFLCKYRNPEKLDSIFRDALAVVKSPYTKKNMGLLKGRISGMALPAFTLKDTAGDPVNLKSLKGKTLLFDFWFNGCGGCSAYYTNVLSKVENRFRENTDVVFVSISVDADKASWEKGIRTEKYTSADALNLYTNGMGIGHDLIKYFSIIEYPTAMLVNADGKIVTFNSPELYREDALVKRIEEATKAD